MPHFCEYQNHGQHDPKLEKVLIFGVNRRSPTENSSLKIFSQICNQCCSQIFCSWLLFFVVVIACCFLLVVVLVLFWSKLSSSLPRLNLHLPPTVYNLHIDDVAINTMGGKKKKKLKHGNWLDRNHSVSSNSLPPVAFTKVPWTWPVSTDNFPPKDSITNHAQNIRRIWTYEYWPLHTECKKWVS